MPRELEDHYPDSSRNAPCPQQLHYYDERRHPRGSHFAGRFDRGDMGPGYYPHDAWSASLRPFFPRPEYEYGPGAPFVREAYGRDMGVDVYRHHRNDYRKNSAEEKDFRSSDGPRNGSMDREHGDRKRHHHKSSKHHHRRSRRHRRHKRTKHSEMDSDDERRNKLPSLTLGAEISRVRWHGSASVARTSAPESDISEEDSQPVGELPNSMSVSVALSPSASPIAVGVPVAYSDDIANDTQEVLRPTTCLEVIKQSTEESGADEVSSSDSESASKKSQSNTSSSDSTCRSPTATKQKTKRHQLMKVRSSYATALAAKLRQNRLALDERSCRRPDTSTSRLQPTDGSPSVIDKSSVTADSSRLCSDTKLVTDNGLNVERLVTAHKQLEVMGNISFTTSASVSVKNSAANSVSSLSAAHSEVRTTASLNWYVVLCETCLLCCYVYDSAEFTLFGFLLHISLIL